MKEVGFWRCRSYDFLILLIIVILSSLNTCESVQEYPKVSILKWLTAESPDWDYDKISDDSIKVKDQEKETVYTVSQHLVALAIVCNASYPVQWVFEHFDRMGMYNVRIRTYRDVEDLNNPKTFKYSAIMEMYADGNRLTGGYSCQSTSSEHIQNNIYIYWPGNSPPFFVHAGQTLTIKSDDNKTMILPCVVSSPDAQVELYKQIAGDYMIEPPSPYINWDPQIGFSLNMEQMDDPFGNYKCIISGGDDEEDVVLISAVPGLETKGKVNNILQGNATFYFDTETRQIKCCSSSAKPPNMRNMYCEDAITCKMKEQYVLQNGNNGIKFRNSSCTADRVYYRDSGVFRCKGDGIDIVRHFFSGYTGSTVNETAPVYLNWKDADPSKLIEVVSHFRIPGGKIYSNQTFYMSCDTSYYYFSEGIHWALKWRNQTVQFLNETYTAYQGSYRRSEMMHTIKLVGDMEMESLTCFAPIWNTTEWANKTFDLNIYQSAPPVLSGPTLEVFTWGLNQTNQSISCVSESGKPAPIIRWKRNNRVVLNDTNLTVRRTTGSSIITFKRVTHDTQGEYKCLAGNVAGRVEKTVRIIVEIPSSSSTGVATFLIVSVVILALAGGMGFLVWKMKLQKKIIDHLAGVVFRDMSSPSNSSTAPPNGQAGSRA